MTSARDHKQRIASAIDRYYATHNTGEMQAEHAQEERRQAKREARQAKGIVTEHEEQRQVVDWLEAHGHRFFAVCNGVVFGMPRQAAIRYHAYLCAEGKRKGVPDLWIGPPKGDRVWTVLEMKAAGAGPPTPEQRDWLDYCEQMGMRALVAHGADEAIRKLREAGY
jgi:hypothetical protein